MLPISPWFAFALPFGCSGTMTLDVAQPGDASCAAPTAWYRDLDGDGFGDPTGSVQDCEQPAGFVLDSSDCDDAAASVNPGATEVCDNLDDDCDGKVDGQDNGLVDGTTWCRDGDGDGVGSEEAGSYRCSQPDGYVADCTDCDDGDASTTSCPDTSTPPDCELGAVPESPAADCAAVLEACPDAPSGDYWLSA